MRWIFEFKVHLAQGIRMSVPDCYVRIKASDHMALLSILGSN